VVGRAEVTAHPTVERNVLELAALAPMAARATEGMTIAGQNARFNALQIDGARYQDMFGASADGAPGGLANARPLPLDAVEQFQVLVAPFDVRHSGFTGGLLNVVTRGGTNEWEAGGFGYYRGHSLMGSLDATAQSGDSPDFRNSLTSSSRSRWNDAPRPAAATTSGAPTRSPRALHPTPLHGSSASCAIRMVWTPADRRR
jgi:hypothetical protein